MRGSSIPVLLAVALGGCSTAETGDSDARDTTTGCRTSVDCADLFPCTVDTCAAGNVCAHEPIDAICEAGARCIVGRGCIVGACMIDDDCDDAIACTVDVCGVGNVCSNQAVDELCADLEECNPAEGGCVPSGECRTAADCADAVACTVDDCAVGNVCVHTPNNGLCDAGEICDATSGCFVSVPCESVADCVDTVDNFCDGNPRCDPEFGCRPPLEPRDCDDSDVCTIDTCDTTAEMCTSAPNCALSECLAAHPECLWNGCFDLSTTIAQRCAMGYVNYSFGRVCLELVAPILYVRPDPPTMLSDGTPMDLEHVGTPTGPDFNASVTVSGGCIETYRLQGAFVDVGGAIDPDHFDATWTATFVEGDGSCSISFCRNQTFPVTGTRVP